MNLEEEVRRGFTVSAEMKQIWKIQMDLLKKLLSVCEKYNLKIWADGGTLLGAVREHGYIPWDDDIDMAMLRNDYDKLVEIAPKEFEHPFFFQCTYYDNDYYIGHAQLRMNGTSAVILDQAISGYRFHMGIFIDIFPYDAIPDNPTEFKILAEQRTRILQRMHKIASGWDPIHPFSSLVCLFRNRILPSLLLKLETVLRRYRIEDCKNVSCISFIVDPEHFLRNKHWYDETVLLPFEDIRIPVPIGYDQILSKQYGDYMTPVKAGSYHGSFWFLSAEKPYYVFLKEREKEIKRMRQDRIKTRCSKLFKRVIGSLI